MGPAQVQGSGDGWAYDEAKHVADNDDWGHKEAKDEADDQTWFGDDQTWFEAREMDDANDEDEDKKKTSWQWDSHMKWTANHDNKDSDEVDSQQQDVASSSFARLD